MPLDGVSSKLLADELNSELCGMRVSGIRQCSKLSLVISFRGYGKSSELFMSCSPSFQCIHLTDRPHKALSAAPMFTMLMRKHFLSAELLSVSTEGYERVFKLCFKKRDELGDNMLRYIYLELMGRRSNLILLDGQQKIIDSMLRINSEKNRFREILPGLKYTAPPVQDKYTPLEVLNIMESRGIESIWVNSELRINISKLLLAKLQGFSPFLISVLLDSFGIDEKKSADELSPDEWKKLCLGIKNFLSMLVNGKYSPSCYFEDESPNALPYDFHAFRIGINPVHEFSNISSAIDFFYSSREENLKFKEKRETLQKRIEKLLSHKQKLRAVHEKEVFESSDFEKLRIEAELITANIYRIKGGESEISLEDYHDGGNKRKISLNPSRSPAWNAQNRFKEYNRLKRKNEKAGELLLNDEADINYLYSLLNALFIAENLSEISEISLEMENSGMFKPIRKNDECGKSKNKRAGKKLKKGYAPPSEPLNFISSDGLSILIGKNNRQNDRLTLKIAGKDDLWFHVKDNAGAHVILKTGSKTVPVRSIEEAASLAAWFSKASGAVGGTKTAVDYCPVSRLKKPNGSRPGFVIYDHYKTVSAEALSPEYLKLEARTST